MNEIRELTDQLRREIPDLEVTIDAPDSPDTGTCWLDIRRGERAVVVEFRPGQGFGVSRAPATDDPLDGLFEGPAVVFRWPAEALRCILELLASSPAKSRRLAIAGSRA